MAKAVYVNLATRDLEKSKHFFEALGYKFDERFTNDDAAGLVISDVIFAMLHTENSIKRFTRKQIADSRTTTEVLIALQVDAREDVDSLLEKAISVGGAEYRETEDHGFMYGRSFEDLDGHIWEVFWMDPSKMPENA